MKQSINQACRYWGLVLTVALGISGWNFASAQSPLSSVEFTKLQGSENVVKADFVLPSSERILKFEVLANGESLPPEKALFIPTDKMAGYRCAVLILADGAMGSSENPQERARLLIAARDSMAKIVAPADVTPPASTDGKAAAATPVNSGKDNQPFKFAVATTAAGQFQILTPLGAYRSHQESGIARLPFTGASSELYSGIKESLKWFDAFEAERKFLVVVSDGITNDKVVTANDVIEAARKSKVRICTVGLSVSSTSAETLQKLATLADQTGGTALRSIGTDARLVNDAEANLLKTMISGGRAEITLDHLSGPVDILCRIQTEFGKTYTLAHKTDLGPALVSAPAPKPEPEPNQPLPVTPPPAPENKDDAKVESKTVTSNARAFPPTLLEKYKSNPALFYGAGGALLLAGLLGLFILFKLLGSRNKVEPVISAPNGFPAFTGVMPEETSLSPAPPSASPVQTPVHSQPALAFLVTVDTQMRHPIKKAAVRIGLKADNDIVLTNDSVSKYHAEILKRGEEFIIADLASSNHTFINGNMVERATLKDGDVIELGEVRLRFHQNSNAAFT